MFAWSDIEEIRESNVLENEDSMIYVFLTKECEIRFSDFYSIKENFNPTEQHWTVDFVDSYEKKIVFTMEDSWKVKQYFDFAIDVLITCADK